MKTEAIAQSNRIPEADVQAHVEDETRVNAVRRVNGVLQLVEVFWNELTGEEQRAARARVFDLRCEYDW